MFWKPFELPPYFWDFLHNTIQSVECLIICSCRKFLSYFHGSSKSQRIKIYLIPKEYCRHTPQRRARFRSTYVSFWRQFCGPVEWRRLQQSDPGGGEKGVAHVWHHNVCVLFERTLPLFLISLRVVAVFQVFWFLLIFKKSIAAFHLA